MRAVVVDDSKAMRSTIRDMLRAVRFQVFEAGDGREGLESLEDFGPMDLALVDWNLPRHSGLELVREVRSRREYDGMRIIMVTTEVDAQTILEGLRLGVDERLVKPFTRETLLEKLTRLRLYRGDL